MALTGSRLCSNKSSTINKRMGWLMVRITLATRCSFSLSRYIFVLSGIAERLSEWPRQLESMEGAAFFQAFLRTGTPFFAFRGISNYVEPRNRNNWQIALAVQNVQKAVLALLPELQ